MGEKHQPLFAEMVKRPGVQYIAGGATQNSIRVAQWMLQTKGSTAYMGCVGKDKNGETMKACCEKDGVTTAYMVDESTPTGSCACLIEGIERSLCTNLCAANNFKVDHVKKPENMKLVQGAKIIYSAGFFITVSTESMKLAQAEAAKSGAKYCLNLSAPFLMQVPPFKAFILESLPMVDYLFCNERGSHLRRNGGLGNFGCEIHCDTTLIGPQRKAGCQAHRCDHPGLRPNGRGHQWAHHRIPSYSSAEGEI